MNSSGLEFGNNAFEGKDPHPDNKREKRTLVGHVIARNNTYLRLWYRWYSIPECDRRSGS